MKTFPIKIEEDLHKKMKHAAIDEGMRLHDWILVAIIEKLQKTKRGNSKYLEVDKNND